MFYKRESLTLSENSRQIYEKLIDLSSDLCLIKNEFDFSFIYDEIKEHYCSNDGRNSIDGIIALKSIFVQKYCGLSERQLERKAKYDIEIKYFLDIDIDAVPFDFSTIWNFKKMLGEEKTENIFNRILWQIKEKGIVKSFKRQAVDTIPIIAAAALPSTSCLIYQAIKEVCGILSPELCAEVFKETELNEEKINHHAKPRAFFDDRRENKIKIFQKSVKRAFAILSIVRKNNIKHESVTLLEKILQENAELNTNKEYQEKQTPHAIKSLVDRDARIGHKSKEQIIFGYKVGISTTAEGITTAYELTPMSNRDDEVLLPILKMQEINGTKCNEVDADSAFGFIQTFALAESRGVTLHAPLRNIDPDKITAYDFAYNKQNNELTCINGITVEGRHSGALTFEFPIKNCRSCPKLGICPLAPSKRITIHQENDTARRALLRQREDQKIRKEKKEKGIKDFNRLVVENVFAYFEKLRIKENRSYSINMTNINVPLSITFANMIKSVRILKRRAEKKDKIEDNFGITTSFAA